MQNILIQKNPHLRKQMQNGGNFQESREYKDVITFTEFLKRLRKQGGHFDEQRFWNQVAQQSIFCLLSLAPELAWLKNKSFQLMKLTFVMDDDHRIWLAKIDDQAKFTERNVNIDITKTMMLHDVL